MKTVLKFSLGWLCVVGMVGCGAASQTDVAEEETVGEQSAALAYSELAKGLRHDFNGDLIEDIIVVKSVNADQPGSFERLGTWGGGFQPSTWTRPDLSGNSVSYVAGDFDGDHRTDLIITTSYGSFEYLGAGGGGFIADAWVRYDLTTANTEYVVGDFNNDGKSDLIITTPGGTYEYLGRAGGGFDSYWSHPMVKGSVKFTTGDFNGDGTTDLIFTHAGGTTLYTGTAGPTGGFTPNVWISYAYYQNYCQLFPGDFNGDGKSDLIIQIGTDARELFGTSTGFTSPTWIRPEYALGNNVNFIPGDYNGDGKWDLIVADGSGARLLPGRSSGGFGASTWFRSDADSYHTAFKRGDFTGDGKDDLLITENLFPGTPGTKEYKGQSVGLSSTSAWTDTTIVAGDSGVF